MNIGEPNNLSITITKYIFQTVRILLFYKDDRENGNNEVFGTQHGIFHVTLRLRTTLQIQWCRVGVLDA